MKKLIETIESRIGDPSRGLPDDIFLLVSRITPLINVDLLIRNGEGETLLTWRDDVYNPPGWHIPGGIIRYKETIADRVNAVAEGELGAKVEFEKAPLAVNEILIDSRRNRGHGISLLYACALTTPPAVELRYQGGSPKRGQWSWHGRCPDDLIPVHEMYRKYL